MYVSNTESTNVLKAASFQSQCNLHYLVDFFAAASAYILLVNGL